MPDRCVGSVLCAVLFVIWTGASSQQTTIGGTGVQTCTTINGYAGQCLPQSECGEEARIDLRTSDTCAKGYHCCATTPRVTNPVAPTKPPARILECDGGRGYCVLKSKCQVYVSRLRISACATYKEVCCPKESTTVKQVGMTDDILPAATPIPSVTTWKPLEEIPTTSDPELPTTVIGDLDEIIDHNGNGTESQEHATEPFLTSAGTMSPSSPTESPTTMDTSPSLDAGSNNTLVLKPTISSALFNYTECGQRTANGIAERSLNVLDRTEYGEIPWMAAIFAMPQKRYCCNGALISERAVLTTAYCITVLCDHAKNQLQVRLGEWDLNASEPLVPVDYEVQRVHKHAKFQSSSMINNIAVLVLTDHVTYGPTVQPVCLPLPEYSVRNTENILVTGWGATVQPVEAQSAGSNILKTVLLHSIDRDTCQKNLRKRHQPVNYRLDESFVCASTQLDERPCRGDAGAPAVIEVPRSDDRYYIHGLVSWGFECDQNVTVHTILTNVAHFRDWINKTLKYIN